MFFVLGSFVVGLVLFIYRKMFNKPTEIKLHEPNWKKDKVYIVQVPIMPEARTLSPFALKLETWLRLHKIDYEPRYSLEKSAKGQTPFIELNGEQVPDSNFVIKFLQKRNGIKPEEEIFSKEALATAHAVKIMVETNTSLVGFYWRYTFHFDKIMTQNFTPNIEYKSWVKVLSCFAVPRFMRLKAYLQGISRHTPEETNELSFDDLRAVSVLLGDKPFLLGDKPSTIDCTLFGHLVQFLYVPLDFPQKAFLREECPNLVEYVNRMKNTIWPDWDEMCDAKCMRGKIGLESSTAKIKTE